MDTPLPPGQNVPSPVPAPAAPVSPLAPAISGAVKTAGFFTTKVIASIIGVVVVGGGIGLGYFVFPEPFYNTVGKYIGLPAPSGVSGPAAQEQERATAEEKIEESKTADTKTETPSSAGESSALFDMLPGADANIAIHIKISDETRSIAEDFNTKMETYRKSLEPQDDSSAPPIIKELSGGRSTPTPLNMFGVNEENKEIFSAIEEIAFVGKQDFSSSKSRNISPEEQSLAIAVKVKTDRVDAFTEILKKAGERKPEIVSVEQKDNVFVIKSITHPLQGQFTDNPIYQNILSANGDLAMVFNVKELIASKLQEDAPSEEKLAADPNLAKQYELMKSVESLALTGSLQKDASEKLVLPLQIRIGMDREDRAAEGLSFIQPQLSGFLMFLPPDFQPFVKIDFSQEKSVVDINVTVQDLETLGQKIVDSLNGIQRSMSKPLHDESPPDLPLLNQPPKEFLIPMNRVPEEESANDGKVLRKRN